MLPPVPLVAEPVFNTIDPLLPSEVVPDLIEIDPDTPPVSVLNVRIVNAPLDVDVPNPVLMETEPPVSEVDSPAERTILPPAPELPLPIETLILPLTPEVDDPVRKEIAPLLPLDVKPVFKAMFPLTPTVPAFDVRMVKAPLLDARP